MNRQYKNNMYDKENKLAIFKMILSGIILSTGVVALIVSKFGLRNTATWLILNTVKLTVIYISPFIIASLVITALTLKKSTQEICLTDNEVNIIHEYTYNRGVISDKHAVYTIPYSRVKSIKKGSRNTVELVCTPLVIEYYTYKTKRKNRAFIDNNTEQTLKLKVNRLTRSNLIREINSKIA